ncbi:MULTISPECIES: class I SAM-dependent methyltransferase [Burkholderia]|uniref:class I SAM-dependent methyltransferase n=1 Tax=Burkholderia TaxID=32008 RepID=UPI0004684D93|nr:MULTISPECIES: class I SAM-dependent methyltransferase [Burkholderia]NIE82643.1 class I SAM-dependent methyltransferase [Burkholderia sp. Tr-860]NIF66887.1 class I SAM-dependent methyltransferase [Burkholderia sp. Cy-647]NIF73022.1 class I SAM-dependent methyltransferase [Burkholderia sp. Ap-962]NIF89644.1 class I SAM-dependent methyltransferase [Burkholderia sp. Cy-637]NIF94855.1 class I SAM-dependent methyltransferase [Burkholderia sp. Ax-1720]
MSDRPIIDWPAWSASPPGRYVLEWEQAQLDRVVSDVFGFHALQLGLPQLDSLRENRMPGRGLVLDPASGASAPFRYPWAGDPPGPHHAPAGRSTVWCDLLELPFESQSVDLIVMPHTLEFTADPHGLLREVERVLMPEGRLVITGFNSLSLWGARQSVGRIANRPFVPAARDPIAFIRLKDWMKLLGFDIERGRFGCYRPPLATDKWMARYAFMEAAGDRWWPIFGAVYMVTAVKRVREMRLVGPIRVRKPVRAPGLAPAATPTTHQEHS